MKLNFIKVICNNTDTTDLELGDVNPERLLDLLAVVTNAITSLNSVGFSPQQIGALLDAVADDKVNPTERIAKLILERSK